MVNSESQNQTIRRLRRTENERQERLDRAQLNQEAGGRRRTAALPPHLAVRLCLTGTSLF